MIFNFISNAINMNYLIECNTIYEIHTLVLSVDFSTSAFQMTMYL